MHLELRKGMILDPGTYNAVIAPEEVVLKAIHNNPDLQRFLFLYISGNYSRLLSSIGRTSNNFEVCRAFTAHQLFTILQNVSHSVVFLEHDPTLYEGAEQMLPTIGELLKDVSRESLVVLYAPAMDRSFYKLIRKADHIIEIAVEDQPPPHPVFRSAEARWKSGQVLPRQTTLEVS